MEYSWNIGNRLSLIKYCTTEKEIEQFCNDNNLKTEYCLTYPKNHFMRADAFYEDEDVKVFIQIYSKKVF